jgi:hypothetical protein
MNWDGIRVTIYAMYDEGGRRFMQSPNGRHPTFTLRLVPGSKPVAYKVLFDNGYMHPCWSGCEPLKATAGSRPPPAVTGLLPLVEGNATEINKNYGEKLADLFAQMQVPDSPLLMLEALMPVTVDGVSRTDRVRMIYLTGVVPIDANTPNDDLVVIALAYADGQGGLQENGGGSGPPH